MADHTGATRSRQPAPGENSRSGPVLETRSIDYIPQSERHGRAWHQAPFWFTGQFVPTTMVVGFAGPVMGLTVGWSITATVLGILFGTCFMAFHANQGPTMGLPQMIQSRAQFGTRGALVPMLAVICVYIGFSAFGVLLASQVLETVLPGSTTLWAVVIVLLAAVLAIVGYDLLHTVLRLLPYLVVPVFGILTVLALMHLSPHHDPHTASFTWAAALAQFVAAAGYQLGYAVYVSDYSRYLPADTSARGVIGWTYAGAALSAIWLMVLGNFIAGSVPVPDALVNLQDIGDTLFSGFGKTAVIAVLVPSAIAIMGVNLYGAMLSGLSIVHAFRPIALTARTRVVGVATGAAVVFAVAEGLPGKYLDSFNDFITLILYALAPWTAVNLIDYYFVRRGHYAITEIFSPDSIYGRWGLAGLLSYALGVAASIPFMTTGFYTGPMVDALDGADIAFVVGLVVSGAAYFLATRGFDPAREREAIRDSRNRLDGPSAVVRSAPRATG
ncbi:purine-cytosine permease family protein [Embleya sp. NPDC059237]|uniref:purine-cytosine permease family protein n=1 Tax=Embleya sp. NPDC059237 TaxID=3346784 RepID=UPI003684BA88